jgi:hypothetical protein
MPAIKPYPMQMVRVRSSKTVAPPIAANSPIVGDLPSGPSLIDIKTGATMMRYEVRRRGGACALSASWETVKPPITKPFAAQPADLPKAAAAE